MGLKTKQLFRTDHERVNQWDSSEGFEQREVLSVPHHGHHMYRRQFGRRGRHFVYLVQISSVQVVLPVDDQRSVRGVHRSLWWPLQFVASTRSRTDGRNKVACPPAKSLRCLRLPSCRFYHCPRTTGFGDCAKLILCCSFSKIGEIRILRLEATYFHFRDSNDGSFTSCSFK